MTAQANTHAFDDPTVPHPARRYNYWLGGRENYRVDRASGDAVAAAMPTVRVGIHENRAFLRRAVRFMVGEGIRQLIDVGPGIPAPDCSHEVAQALAPETRVLYVDNDPVVIAYSRALLRSAALPPVDEDGREFAAAVDLDFGSADEDEEAEAHIDTAPGVLGLDEPAEIDEIDEIEVIEEIDEVNGSGAPTETRGLIGHVLADLCEPERILANAELRTVIDFSQPVGLLMVAVAHFCVKDEEVFTAVKRLIDVLPSGSVVAFSHAATDYLDPRTKGRVDAANRDHRSPFAFRYSFEIARFAAGLEILDPGVVPISLWRAEDEAQPRPSAADTGIAAWVARKP
ncbi:SAM-dependent methyltransferase [Actinospica durhamensis]|uniref:SAM-dependent methyltransferase n=1 Tax=Actinospica durhamensis TaxID=1508375 RepID=A0A941EN59_9ACTN|nr:SAM-dependent methyltransferase [Actinospica durhamensis]MBR7834156.1 SAM-dependent methyltransferase [Actinospica durhamensis]